MEFPNGPWRPYERSTTAIIIVAAAGQGGIESSGAPRGSVLARAGRRTLVISCELEGLGTEAALSGALEAWVGVVLGGVRQARRRPSSEAARVDLLRGDEHCRSKTEQSSGPS